MKVIKGSAKKSILEKLDSRYSFDWMQTQIESERAKGKQTSSRKKQGSKLSANHDHVSRPWICPRGMCASLFFSKNKSNVKNNVSEFIGNNAFFSHQYNPSHTHARNHSSIAESFVLSIKIIIRKHFIIVSTYV